MSSFTDNKPVIGFTCGDINGIGIELLIKTLGDNRILDICTPIIFGNNKVINFYRKNFYLKSISTLLLLKTLGELIINN